MNMFFYILIFLFGACAGSFYATLIQRIIKEKRLFSIHSHCLKCGEKLTILDQIPIFSYMFLKGKCKYCQKKIKTQYILLEILTGIIFAITAYTFSALDGIVINIISFVFIILYFSYIILVAGVDFKERTMPAILLAYGIIISIVYMVYLLFTKNITLYASTIYFLVMVLLLLVNILNTKKRAKSSYIIDLLTMILIMLVFTGEIVCILTIAGTLLSIALYILINKIKQSKIKLKKGKNIYSSNISIVYIMAILNIFIFLMLLNINR